jgi:hypothetical protein
MSRHRQGNCFGWEKKVFIVAPEGPWWGNVLKQVFLGKSINDRQIIIKSFWAKWS